MEHEGASPANDLAGRRRDDRRRLIGALVVSAAVHGLILSGRYEAGMADAGTGASRTLEVGWGRPVMRALELAITSDAAAPRIVAAQRDDGVVTAEVAERTEAADIGAPTVVAEPSRAGEEGSRRDPGRPLAPRMTDPRLWLERGRVARPDVEEAARIRAPIREGVAAINDSIAAADERESKASDWTSSDEEGGRWGISPDRVHLGGLTLKLRHCTVEPCEGWLFPTPADRKDEYENRLGGFAEIRLQVSRADLEDALRVRAAAVRARMNAQRDSTEAGG
jgi:hypothetical protein